MASEPTIRILTAVWHCGGQRTAGLPIPEYGKVRGLRDVANDPSVISSQKCEQPIPEEFVLAGDWLISLQPGTELLGNGFVFNEQIDEAHVGLIKLIANLLKSIETGEQITLNETAFWQDPGSWILPCKLSSNGTVKNATRLSVG